MKRKWLFLPAALLATLSIGGTIGYIRSDNYRFEKYTREYFSQEITDNTLDLHYTLAHPEKMHLISGSPSIGHISSSNTSSYQKLQTQINELGEYSYENLSQDNQIILDMLILHLQTEQTFDDSYPMAEYLSPTLGIQAQLPVLLAEYTFYDEQDISDYLQILSQVDTYFQEIVQYEEKKSSLGLFMSDQTLNRILLQCQSYLSDKNHTYLEESFQERLDTLSLSDAQKENYRKQHTRIIQQSLTPAYQHLMKGLSQYRGTGKNENGLYYYNGGREYYQYLIRSMVGDYDSIQGIQQRLSAEFAREFQLLRKILTDHPELVNQQEFTLPYKTPEEMLDKLHYLSQEDFPVLQNASYQVKTVPDSLKAYVSPAFYLVPPIDTLSPNVIYINTPENYDSLTLFTTLSHEGFPGHLYQTMYFAGTHPDPIRYLFNYGGYVEGWATYIEAYAYSYASDTTLYPEVMWLNRSMNLCLYSMLDINIHYLGWTEENVTSYLASFGITDPDGIHDLYLNIVENPANFLKYYLGYLNFRELKTTCHNNTSDDFDLKAFHKQLLELGPLPFSLVEKYLLPNYPK